MPKWSGNRGQLPILARGDFPRGKPLGESRELSRFPELSFYLTVWTVTKEGASGER
mgnify:CR=1 FL=1